MVKIVDKKKKWNKILAQGKDLKKNPVVGVGYPENKVDNSIIRYAAINHYGVSIHITDKMRGWFMTQGVFLKKETGEIKIPPRPFLAVAIDTNKEKIFKLKNKFGSLVLAGEMSVEKSLGILGAAVKGMIQQTISGSFFKTNVPNSSLTSEWKKSNTPLIGKTGLLRSSVTWEVFMNGKTE